MRGVRVDAGEAVGALILGGVSGLVAMVASQVGWGEPWAGGRAPLMVGLFRAYVILGAILGLLGAAIAAAVLRFCVGARRLAWTLPLLFVSATLPPVGYTLTVGTGWAAAAIWAGVASVVAMAVSVKSARGRARAQQVRDHLG